MFVCQQTSVPDSESNPDHNCLSRCSTEIFSEASWEQVDKQDSEVQASIHLRRLPPPLCLLSTRHTNHAAPSGPNTGLHKLSSSTLQLSQKLLRLCAGAKVSLLSALPLWEVTKAILGFAHLPAEGRRAKQASVWWLSQSQLGLGFLCQKTLPRFSPPGPLLSSLPKAAASQISLSLAVFSLL